MKNLKAIRVKLGLSQQQVADAVCMSRAHYCNIENCKRAPSLENAAALSTFLGVSIDELQGTSSGEVDSTQLLNSLYRELNAVGRELAVDYLSMLASKPQYREKDSSESAV